MIREILHNLFWIWNKTNASKYQAGKECSKKAYDLPGRAQNLTRGKGWKGYEDYSATIRFP